MKIHVFGDTGKEKIILLHPMFSSGREMYEDFRDHFGNYCIIAPDISGYGEDRTEYVSAEKESEFLKNYLLENGFTDIKLLYGMSLGSRIALELMNEEGLNFSLVYMDGVPAYRNSKSSRLYYVPMYLGKLISRNKFVASIKDFFSKAGLLPKKILSYTRLSRQALGRMIIDCSIFDFYELSREQQERTVFDYGSAEFDLRCTEELKNNYPHSTYTVRDGYGHCQYARKNRHKFMSELKEHLRRHK